MKRGVIYTRVSSHKQVDNYSLPHQEAECRRYCEREGIEIDAVFIERGETAKTADRTELNKLLVYCRRNRRSIDYVIVFKVNRFTRKALDHNTLGALLAKYGIGLRSATEQIDETPAGRFVGTVLAAQGELENDIKAEFTRENMRNALLAGRWTHKAPLGYLNAPKGRGGPSLEFDPSCASLVRSAFEMYATGNWSKTDVLRQITARGLRTRRGRKLTAQDISKMLKNRLYEGWIESSKWDVSVEGDFPPLVDKRVFARVQRVLAGRGRTKKPRKWNDPALPLRRFVRCSWCGTPLTGNHAQGRSKKYPYYWCKDRDCIGDGERRVFVKKAEIESQFIEQLEALKPAPELAAVLVEVLRDVWRKRNEETVRRRNDLEARRAKIESKKRRVVSAFLYEQSIDQETYQSELARLRDEEAEVGMALEDVQCAEPSQDELLDAAHEVLLDPAQPWVNGSPDQRLDYQRFIFPEGLDFDGAQFRTAVTSPVFGWLRSLERGEEEMVTPWGFEPQSPG